MDSAAPKKPPLQGFLQGFQPDRIRGWAYMPARPDDHMRIEVRLDGELVTQTIASMQFPDLQKNNVGKGDHGFLINLKQDLPVDQAERVKVIAIGPDGTRRVLQMSTAARARAAASPPMPVSPVSPAPPARPAPPAPVSETPPSLPAPATGALPHLVSVDLSQRPVFVLGSARSGTTAMMAALRQSGRYAGFNEGHFLTLFGRLQNAVGIHYGRSVRDAAPGMNTLIANVPQQMVIDALQGAFNEIIRAIFPTGYWLDKTPGPDMIKTAPMLRRIWPEARFIFMRRAPVDNIESRRRKFPTISFKDHCRLWADSMISWHAIRGELAEVSLEVDQLRMGLQPEHVAAEVAALLNLTERETARLLQSFKQDRPQRTGSTITSVVDIASVDWTEEEREIFRETCGDAIELFGYEVDLAAPVRGRTDRPNRRNPANC
jgi:hypothetical protein